MCPETTREGQSHRAWPGHNSRGMGRDIQGSVVTLGCVGAGSRRTQQPRDPMGLRNYKEWEQGLLVWAARVHISTCPGTGQTSVFLGASSGSLVL